MAVSALEAVAPRHSWSADSLRIVSPSAAVSSGLGALEAAVVAPEIHWSASAAASGKAEAAKPIIRRMWQGGDVAVDLNMRHTKLTVRHSVR